MAATGLTSPYSIPFPNPTDPADISGDIELLALRVNTLFGTVPTLTGSNTFSGINTFSNDNILNGSNTIGGSGKTTTFTGTVSLPSTTSIGSVSSTELGYLDGVTSAIQTQLDAKAALASPTFTGTPLAPTASVDTNTTQIATTAFVVGQGYLKSSDASSTYLTQSNASSTYLTQSNAASTYLTQSNAASTYLTQSSAASTYLTESSASLLYQPLDGDLTSIAGLSGTSGLLRKGSANNWSLDTTTYIGASENITLTGVISGSGTYSSISTSMNWSIISPSAGAYTIQTTDVGVEKMVLLSGSSAADVSIPNSGFDVGAQVNIMQTGTGQFTIVAGSGSTVNFNSSRNKLNGQWAAATLIKIANGTWVAIGNLTA